MTIMRQGTTEALGEPGDGDGAPPSRRALWARVAGVGVTIALLVIVLARTGLLTAIRLPHYNSPPDGWLRYQDPAAYFSAWLPSSWVAATPGQPPVHSGPLPEGVLLGESPNANATFALSIRVYPINDSATRQQWCSNLPPSNMTLASGIPAYRLDDGGAPRRLEFATQTAEYRVDVRYQVDTPDPTIAPRNTQDDERTAATIIDWFTPASQTPLVCT